MSIFKLKNTLTKNVCTSILYTSITSAQLVDANACLPHNDDDYDSDKDANVKTVLYFFSLKNMQAYNTHFRKLTDIKYFCCLCVSCMKKSRNHSASLFMPPI